MPLEQDADDGICTRCIVLSPQREQDSIDWEIWEIGKYWSNEEIDQENTGEKAKGDGQVIL